jgi:uncharacterized protein (DUF927 family)
MCTVCTAFRPMAPTKRKLSNMTNHIRIRKTARIHNLRSRTYVERIEFLTSADRQTTIELPPSVINDQRLFSKHLRDAGAILPTNKSTLKTLLESVASSAVKRELQYTAQPGWTDDRRTFVRTNGAIGKASKRVLGFQRSNAADPRGMARLSGTVEKWKKSIGKSAKHSTILTFAVASAFAAPILKLLDMRSFGFCLFSESRTGKTLATLFAGSVIGLGGSENILDWNVTDARLQELLREFNDSLTPIDDLMSMKGTDREKYTRIKSLAYIMSSGSGTGRHTSFERNSTKWTSIVLTSNEHSIREMATKARTERDSGETIRLVDLPAIFNGAADIFDQAPELSDPVEQLAWRSRAFERLFRSCQQQQGHVFVSFLGHLISHGPSLREDIEKFARNFTSSVCDRADGNLARDVASKFAIIYAAGRLAIRYDLLPWKISDLKDALQRCYFASRDLLPDPGVTLRSGRKMLRAYLKTLPTLKELKKHDLGAVEGFSEELPGYYRCMVRREKYNAVFSSNAQLRAVTEQLIAEKCITISQAPGSKEPQAQHFWPDGQRCRCIEIRWPRGGR